MTEFFGALTEAWGQVRIGKLRVLLSLVGVAVAVAAMTFVIALGQVSIKAMQDLNEQWMGRPGTVNVTISPQTTGSDAEGSAGASNPGSSVGSWDSSGQDGDSSSDSTPGSDASSANTQAAKVSDAMTQFVARYDVNVSATSYDTQVRFAFPDGPATVQTKAVSLQYGMLHRTTLDQGRWFRADDADDLAPSIIVSKGFLDMLGLSDLTEPVAVEAYLPSHATYTIVGVLPPETDGGCTMSDESGVSIPCPEPISAMVLRDPFERWLPDDVQRPIPTLELWAGREHDNEMVSLARQDFNAQFGTGSTTATSNLTMSQGESSADGFVTVVTAAGVFVMLLGALGLLNISLVTVRQRIHEIGVRRSFGATSGRIFFSIMLESVVATVLAGLVGIAVAIVAMRVAPLESILYMPIKVRPPFPMSAALIGLLAATGVGGLAGIIPAIVAVRIKPIDAIRY